MNSSTAVPILYLSDDDDDDDDDDNRQDHFNGHSPKKQCSNRHGFSGGTAYSVNGSLSRGKRKLTNTNVRINQSMVNWSKRQRYDDCQHESVQNSAKTASQSDPILLDPKDYIVEEPDTSVFRSFDWTIDSGSSTSSKQLPSYIPKDSVVKEPKKSHSTVNNITKSPTNKTKKIITNRNLYNKFNEKQNNISTLALTDTIPKNLPLLSSQFALPANRTTSLAGLSTNSHPIFSSLTTSSPLSILSFPQSSPSTISSTTPTSATNILRQPLNGTGLFSAFYDSKYYRCNICKFKSATSSSLLQHLFTHMFFCDQCSFYTYSNYNLVQHLSEKHSNDSSIPDAMDMLYVTRCQDGTFALCMDSSSPKIMDEQTTNDNQQPTLLPQIHNDREKPKQSKKNVRRSNRLIDKSINNDDETDIIVLSEKKLIQQNQSSVPLKKRIKPSSAYILMKHRRVFSSKRPICLHSLTLEYKICRENTIRQICRTENILKRRNFLFNDHRTWMFNEVSDCLRTMVDRIIDNDDKNDTSSLICNLPENILGSALSITDLSTIMTHLKLRNRYDKLKQEIHLYESENTIRRNQKSLFILATPDSDTDQQTVIKFLTSSITSCNSKFTQTNIPKLSFQNDNSHLYLKGNQNSQMQNNLLNRKTRTNNDDRTVYTPPKLLPTNTTVSNSMFILTKSTSADKKNTKSRIKSPSIIVID